MQVNLVHFLEYILALQMIIMCELQHVMGFGSFSCVRQSASGPGHTRVTFLVQEDAGLRLFSTLWTDSMSLQSCEVQENPVAVENYRSFCNRSRQEEGFTQRLNLNLTLSPDAPCVRTDARRGVQSASAAGHVRTKRSWIFPGTLWCGTGSKAFRNDQLGMFESADSCCREHDHCLHTISAFTVNYGVFNPNVYTVSHCDCDVRFRQCLVDVNDTISSMVLYSFFKLIKVPCFELKMQKRCTELYWWGVCKKTQEAPVAIFKKTIYKSTSSISKSEKSDSKSAANQAGLLTGIQEMKLPRKKPRSEEKCIPEDPPRGDTFLRTTTNGCRRHRAKQSTLAPDLHSTGIYNRTKRIKSLSIKRASLVTANPYVKLTSPTTARASKRPDTLQLIRTTTTATTTTTTTTTRPRVRGHRPSTENPFHSQSKRTHLTRTFPAVTPTKDLNFTWTFTTSGSHNANGTTLQPFTQYSERKTQRQMHSPLPAQAANYLNNSGDIDTKQNKTTLSNDTDYCESLKHLDGCKYKIPPLKKRFGLKNQDTKPAYHCPCTKRLAQEIQSLKQSSLLLFLVDLVSEHCFKLPKRTKCKSGKSCSGGFSKASDLLQALKKIEQNDIAGVRNSGALRKGRISVQLYKRCLRLRKGATAALT